MLEVGCGSWSLAKQLTEPNGVEWFGIDPLEEDDKGRRTIATHIATVDALPFEDDRFDYVLGIQTMEHWREYGTTYRRGLGELRRVLKPGGILSLNVPIHLHGDRIFLRGEEDRIRAKFRDDQWERVTWEPWRKDYQPLAPYDGWRRCGRPDRAVRKSDQQPAPSSWILQMRFRKQ